MNIYLYFPLTFSCLVAYTSTTMPLYHLHSKTITYDVTLTLHDITLHFHSRFHLPVPKSTHAYVHGFIMLPPCQPHVFAWLARWQLTADDLAKMSFFFKHQKGLLYRSWWCSGAMVGVLVSRLRHQGLSPGGESLFVSLGKTLSSLSSQVNKWVPANAGGNLVMD